LLRNLITQVEKAGIAGAVDITASFCHEACDRGPTVVGGGVTIHKATTEQVLAAIASAVGAGAPPAQPEAVRG
jgi:NADH:ubiquinone oxidoreductase subunit E